jgi:hypothetical protein
MKTFTEWWENKLDKDPEFLEYFASGYDGMMDLAREAWEASENSVKEQMRETMKPMDGVYPRY